MRLLHRLDGQRGRGVQAAIGLPDQSAAAIQAADGSDGVLIATAAGDVVKIVQPLRQSGFEEVIAVPSSSVAESLDALGDAGNGLLLTSQVTPVSTSGDATIEQVTAEMDAEDAGASKDERSLTTWTAIKLFTELADRLDGDVTAQAVTGPANVLARSQPLPGRRWATPTGSSGLDRPR